MLTDAENLTHKIIMRRGFRQNRVADACIEAARRIMIEILALRAGPPQGRA
jgi:hypothetical protein